MDRDTKLIAILRRQYHILLNSQPGTMHFAYSDWFTQSWLSAHIPLFDLIWLSVAKLKCFRQKAKFFSELSQKRKKKLFCGKFRSLNPLFFGNKYLLQIFKALLSGGYDTEHKFVTSQNLRDPSICFC